MLTRQQIALQIAEKLREIATRQGRIPFDTGDLRKSVVVQPQGQHGAQVGSNLPYARAVHDGRPKIVIRPKGKRALSWPGADHPVAKVEQPARPGQPFLLQAVEALAREGVGFLAPQIGDAVARQITDFLRAQGLKVTRGKR